MPTEPAETSSLDPNDILTAEFEYISQTAFQANEDRARVTNFYLVTLVGFIAALLGTQLDNLMVPHVYWAFAALFVVLFLASILTLLQLVRLREAWFESIKAINDIKTYYQAKLPELELGTALRWKATTVPACYKPWSVGFLLALQVAVLGGDGRRCRHLHRADLGRVAMGMGCGRCSALRRHANGLVPLLAASAELLSRRRAIRQRVLIALGPRDSVPEVEVPSARLRKNIHCLPGESVA